MGARRRDQHEREEKGREERSGGLGVSGIPHTDSVRLTSAGFSGRRVKKDWVSKHISSSHFSWTSVVPL